MGICFSFDKDKKIKSNKKISHQSTEYIGKDKRIKMVKMEGIHRKVATLNV